MAAASPSPRQRLGRRVALGLFWVVAVWISVAAALAVTRGVFTGAPEGAAHVSCSEGLRALSGAIVRARTAAAGSEGSEDEALARFRGGLEPEWSTHNAVTAACHGRAEDERALDALERLRYAEEHAVRREAGELAPLRRRVQSVVDAPNGPANSEAPRP